MRISAALWFALAAFLSAGASHAACPALLERKNGNTQRRGSIALPVRRQGAAGGVSFPMFAKTGVRSGAANPFYEGLAKASGSAPQWNFHKYLIDRRAGKVAPFATKVAPEDPKLLGEIERMLAERSNRAQ